MSLAHQEGEVSYRMVILESPFKGHVRRNKAYLDACMRDCILNYLDAPFASHKLYTDSLDDNDSLERQIGIKAGLAWGSQADAVVVYTDFGISEGMRQGIANAEKNGVPIELRKLPFNALQDIKWNNEC